MEVPLSWLKDYVRLTLEPEALAARLTFAGLEVEDITSVGLPALPGRSAEGLAWAPEKIVVGEVREVLPHPNADRLVLCRLFDGREVHTVLTGASNLFPFKGQGPLAQPLKVAYAREGATLYDGHAPGRVLTTLQPMKIRGVESSSMICSEKELGLSDEHEGVMILDPEAPTGAPLVEVLGDRVFSVKINPNMARAASLVGIAREVAALTGQKLRQPSYTLRGRGKPLRGSLRLEIRRPDLNPRFTAALIRGLRIGSSPEWMQRRLRRAGMRPINNVVDITNYVMLETGQPLHAFDWEVLQRRAGSEPVVIHTRLAEAGERLTTLDGVERVLEDYMILVCDARGPLSIAGVMGGAESEVTEGTTAILLEGAAWDFISIRRAVQALRLPSEASYRFLRGVHPAMTLRGVARAASLMADVCQGVVARDVVDAYPRKAARVTVDLPLARVEAMLGAPIAQGEVVRILERLEFGVEPRPSRPAARGRRNPRAKAPRVLHVSVPDHRLDIGPGVVGQADLIEEIARVYGYERIPEAQLATLLPPQRDNPGLEREEAVRDLLVQAGLQEVITYRFTSPEREAQLDPAGEVLPRSRYVEITNPVGPDRNALRRSLLSSVMEVAARQMGQRPRVAVFEIGPVFHPKGETLPEEPLRLAIVLSGLRETAHWSGAAPAPMDFYDLKGILELLTLGLHVEGLTLAEAPHPSFHPGKSASLLVAGRAIGVLGELHPLVAQRFGFAQPVLAADLDLQMLLDSLPARFSVSPIPSLPPVLEDLALIVAEDVPAGRIMEVMRTAGSPLLREVRLFDVYRGVQAGEGKKSLALSLTYQADDRTLTDGEVAQVRMHIIRALEEACGAHIRSAA
jgi:phenylalanyl-tRNA synthetase beta chain